MALGAGTRLGPYEVLAPIGAGGMGEVYRARDTRLNRDVAIKVLPEEFARDPERLARFEREAQLLASLNHPNIAGIYGLEESAAADGIRYLALEYVPGDTLAERLQRGPLPLDEALDASKQIAEALEAAHEKGIIHRDLKPANVKITPAGKVKVLDFGLAKDVAPALSAGDLSKSPTVTLGATQAGVILGTAAYMAPEQARGKTVDKRADIWAFGCVLYECLSGKQAFGGETFSDTTASLLTRDVDTTALPASTPLPVRALLRRCLQKEPRQRLHDIADARIVMEEVMAGVAEAPPVPAKAAAGSRAVLWALALLAAAAVCFATWSMVRAPERKTPAAARVLIGLPDKTSIALGRGSSVAISSDGRRIVYVASAEGRTRLYLRSLDQFDSTPIEGTEGASNPFFSPDDQWVGFFSGGKLKKAALGGGAPVTVCDAAGARGEAWAPDDTIFFTPSSVSGLWRVPAAGGAPQALTTPAKGELSHRWPQALPAAKAVLFTIWNDTGFENARVAVHMLDTGKRRVLVEGGGYGRFVPTGGAAGTAGHLVYARAEGLLAAPFDLRRLETTGPAVPVLEGVTTNLSGGAHFGVSSEGSLVYIAGSLRELDKTLLWVDRSGASEKLAQIRGMSLFYQLSPDGRRLVRSNTEGASRDVWIYELDRGASIRLTHEPNNFYPNPIWTPDGKRVTYNSDKGSLPNANIYWRPADGSGSEERLLSAENEVWATSWSPDGKELLYTEVHPERRADIWVFTLEGRTTRPLVQTKFHETGAVFSPDGRWAAYHSNESGRPEVYVQAYPEGGRRWQVSTEGGAWPVWARSGEELFYRNGDSLMAARVKRRPEFVVDKPQKLFTGRYETYFDVARDGRRFLMLKGAEPDLAPTRLNVVLNWFEDLKLRAPAGKNR